MRRIIPIISIALVATAISSCRGGSSDPTVIAGNRTPAEVVRQLLAEDTTSMWEPATLDMPDVGIPIKINHVGHYAEVFNDSNYLHWADAEPAGIAPITDTRGHWHTRRPLEKIVSCRDFYVDELRYSSPYLVPRAARMLHEIGRRFRDTLEARGGGEYRIKVTSALRTPRSVKLLRRVNSNSVDSSTHLLGTTVDISYARFICDNPAIPRSAEHLKGILAEILYQMRDEGWCWVKYEAKQPCFHISCRHSEEQ